MVRIRNLTGWHGSDGEDQELQGGEQGEAPTKKTNQQANVRQISIAVSKQALQ